MKSLKLIIQNYRRKCGIPLRRDNSKFKIIFIFIAFLILNTLYVILNTTAVEAAVRYPVSDLGNCRNQNECRLYCQIPQNTAACWSYDRYVLNKNVLGEETSKITFPVPELGNCGSALECRTYCAKPENRDACREFAVKNGLAKPSALSQKIIAAAKAELSCNTISECKTACERPENKDICQSFAKKHKIENKATALTKEVIAQAKSELGCTDVKSCKAFCEKPENSDRCLDFAQKFQLIKKEILEKVRATKLMLGEAQKELGCDSEQSCAAFCRNSANSSKCKEIAEKYRQRASESANAAFLSAKPGAPCANDKSCIEYCQEHPSECPGFAEAQKAFLEIQPTGSGSPPAHAKFKIGDFLGPTGCLTEGECKAYCEKFPDKCPSFPKKPTSFPTIKLSIPAERSNSNKGPGSTNSGKGSFSNLVKTTKTPEIEDETEIEPTEAPEVEEPEATEIPEL